MNANIRIGDAAAVAAFAADPKASEERRIEALTALANWKEPQVRDLVLGDWRPIENRDPGPARAALAKHFAAVCKSSEAVRAEAIAAAGALKLQGVDDVLIAMAEDNSSSAPVRISAVNSLAALESKSLIPLFDKLKGGFDSLPGDLSGALIKAVGKTDENRAMETMEFLFAENAGSESKMIVRGQMAIQALGTMSGQESADKLSTLMMNVIKTEENEQWRLDIVEAAEQRKEPAFHRMLAEYRKKISDANDPTAQFRDTLYGGDVAAGKKIFHGKTSVSCLRCHKVDSVGGEVGPDLSGVALKNDRQKLLESIVVPNKVIKEGYAQMVVSTLDGEILTGLESAKSDKTTLRLLNADGVTVSIPRDDIDESRMGLSSMPADLIKSLSMRELRDLIEYLATRKSTEQPGSEKGAHGE